MRSDEDHQQVQMQTMPHSPNPPLIVTASAREVMQPIGSHLDHFAFGWKVPAWHPGLSSLGCPPHRPLRLPSCLLGLKVGTLLYTGVRDLMPRPTRDCHAVLCYAVLRRDLETRPFPEACGGRLSVPSISILSEKSEHPPALGPFCPPHRRWPLFDFLAPYIDLP